MFPEEHANLVATAKEATQNGFLHGHKYLILPPGQIDEIDPKRQEISDRIGSVIFDPQNPEFAKLTLDSFKELNDKLRHYGSKVIVTLGGSNAVALQMPNHDLFSFSDLDFKVMINPTLPQKEFEEIKTCVSYVCNQVFATHKRRLDRLLFKKREGDGESQYFFSSKEQEIKFRTAMLENMPSYCISPLSDDLVRNRLTNKSYMITESLVVLGSSVKIDVSNLPKAERIPLVPTPIFVSVNDSIKRVDPETERVTSFTLYRVRMKHMILRDSDKICVHLRVNKDKGDVIELQLYKPYDKVNADFVDCSIPNRDDTELLSFEKRGGFRFALSQKVSAYGFVLTVPTLEECRFEYEKMLTVFDCPESKREKREKRLSALNEALSRSQRPMMPVQVHYPMYQVPYQVPYPTIQLFPQVHRIPSVPSEPVTPKKQVHSMSRKKTKRDI
jgi:hypothetical protein